MRERESALDEQLSVELEATSDYLERAETSTPVIFGRDLAGQLACHGRRPCALSRECAVPIEEEEEGDGERGTGAQSCEKRRDETPVRLRRHSQGAQLHQFRKCILSRQTRRFR